VVPFSVRFSCRRSQLRVSFVGNKKPLGPRAREVKANAYEALAAR
jgi:hypothetical protein